MAEMKYFFFFFGRPQTLRTYTCWLSEVEQVTTTRDRNLNFHLSISVLSSLGINSTTSKGVGKGVRKDERKLV